MTDRKVIEGSLELKGSLFTHDGTIAGLHSEFLQRTDDGEYEAAQTGVEYFSPDQHGGIYGKVLRQYFQETVATDLDGTTISGLSQIVLQGGYVTILSSSIQHSFPWQDGTTNNNAFYSTDASGFTIHSTWTGPCLVWVDYTLTTEPTLSPGTLIQPVTDPTVIQRVDDLTWETAQIGVEYFSPNQYGGIHGKIVRIFTDTLTTSQVAATGVKVMIGGMIIQDNGAGAATASLVSLSAGGMYTYFTHNTTTYEVTVQNGHGGTFVAGSCIDYVPVTEPTTSPTGQPFADPSSPLLKRVDTGRYEIPQDDTEYYAREQSKGRGETVYYKQYSGTTGSASVALDATITDFKAFVSMGGSVNDIVGGYIVHPGTYLSTTTYAYIRRNSTGIGLNVGLRFEDSSDTYEVWIEYTKV